MAEKFIQKTIHLNELKSSDRLKISKLCSLIEDHPCRDYIYDSFQVEKIKDQYILIDSIDVVYERVKLYMDNYRRYNILARNGDITISAINSNVEENSDKVVFYFDEYIDIDEVRNGLEAIAIYNSKNSFFEQYKMAKYANNLISIGEVELVRQNIEHFRKKAQANTKYDKHKSYRLVETNNETFLRGITSTNYNEYGVDFAFVLTMLSLHENMQRNKGAGYKFSSAALNESKLEMILTETIHKNSKAFGKVSSAIKISTNDLGNGALKYSNIVSVIPSSSSEFYLLPREQGSNMNFKNFSVSHKKSPEKLFGEISDLRLILNTSDEFLDELNDIKGLKTPDELRMKILNKISNPNSAFKEIKKLSDIFKRKIDNQISGLSKLLEMCNKAEEFDIEDYNLKDKLRYIISDIILYGNTNS
jgi:hypothetical protein